MAGGLLALLAGCSNSPQPYILANWKAGDAEQYAVATRTPQKGPNGKPTFSICYSRLASSVDEIRRMVAANCTNPGLMQNRVDLYTCSISAPSRATFSCDALSREARETRPNLAPSSSFTGSFNVY